MRRGQDEDIFVFDLLQYSFVSDFSNKHKALNKVNKVNKANNYVQIPFQLETSVM